MKKIMITLLSVLAMLSFSAAVWAGPFEHYYDYQNDESADVGSFLTGGMAGGPVAGGWTVTNTSEITEEELEVFDQAVQDIDDVVYEPVALLATQVVAGMNYCFLARETS